MVFLCVKFLCVVELDKPCYCNLKVVNNREHHVAFKVHGFSISWYNPQDFRFVFGELSDKVWSEFIPFLSGQDNISEEVFRPAEREYRAAVGFLHYNK